MALADRIAVMDNGRIMQIGEPQKIYHEPANEMVASFISHGMVMPVDIKSPERNETCEAVVMGQPITLRCSAGEVPRSGALACFRAEHVRPAAGEEPGFDGLVRRVVYQGGLARVDFVPDAAPDQTIHFEQPDPQPFHAGDRARLAFSSGWLIPPETGSRESG